MAFPDTNGLNVNESFCNLHFFGNYGLSVVSFNLYNRHFSSCLRLYKEKAVNLVNVERTWDRTSAEKVNEYREKSNNLQLTLIFALSGPRCNERTIPSKISITFCESKQLNDILTEAKKSGRSRGKFFGISKENINICTFGICCPSAFRCKIYSLT